MAVGKKATPVAPEPEGEVCIPINVSEQVEFCYARGWTDGLPVMSATRQLVDEMLEGTPYFPPTP